MKTLPLNQADASRWLLCALRDPIQLGHFRNNQRNPKSTGALAQFLRVPCSSSSSQRQFSSVKQPLPTEIQLRITATAQPNSPVKNMTSTTRIANTANLKAMIGPFYSAPEPLEPCRYPSMLTVQRESRPELVVGLFAVNQEHSYASNAASPVH